jgi:outer membrane protein assembly factor BamB
LEIKTSSSPVWSLETGSYATDDPQVFGLDFGAFGAFAFDPESDLVVTGTARYTFNFGGRSWASGSVVVFKLDANTGDFIWGQELANFKGTIGAMGISAKGTILLSGVFQGAFSWGNAALSSSTDSSAGFLLAIESSGEFRWAKQLPMDSAPMIAVDPAGQVVVANNEFGSCTTAHIAKYDLAGDFLWERRIAPVPCSGGVKLSGVALSGHNPVLWGNYSGTVDFGKGPPATGSQSGFLIDLAP